MEIQKGGDIPICTDDSFCYTEANTASLVVQLVKNSPAKQEISVQFLGQEDLQKEQATHSSVPGLPLWLSW